MTMRQGAFLLAGAAPAGSAETLWDSAIIWITKADL